jgi:DNA-binding MarR family transcriptional regulator
MDESRKSSTSRSSVAPDASASIAEQLREIASLSTQFQKHVGHSLSVNDTDLSAMEHLMMSGPLSPTDLARRLEISTAAATVMVDRLTALGHVHREPHAHDRRKVVVVPTPSSVEAAFETLAPMLSGVARVTAQLPAADHEVVTKFLSEVIGVFRGAIAPAD